MDKGILSMEMQLAVRVLNYWLNLEKELKKEMVLGRLYELNERIDLSWVKMSTKWQVCWTSEADIAGSEGLQDEYWE